MNLTECTTLVRRYNAWRRGDEDIEQPQPYQIGQALDALCDRAEELEAKYRLHHAEAERLERELAACKHGTMLLEAELEKFDEKAISWWCEYQDLKAKAGDDRAELKQIKAILADPHAVHLNMMRGTIQWTPANLRHLLGDS